VPTRDIHPLLDLRALQTLEADLEDTEPVRGFVQDFISVWDERYRRLVEALAYASDKAAREKAAREVLLSIKVSSVMLGAMQLNNAAETVELHLTRGNACVPDSLLNALGDCGRRTIQQLTQAYLRSTGR
jgi:HPt (histidine-containing phosphotransfer) domain-containing protein